MVNSFAPGQSLIWTIFSLLCISTVFAKEVDGVFKSIDSLTFYQGDRNSPFDFYKAEVSWSLDPSKISTGDTFSLNMPYVYEVRLTTGSGFQNFFDIVLGDGKHIASCTIDQAGGRSLATKVNCQLTADVSSYQSLSGKLDFDVVFEGGGRVETVEGAKQWTAGSNTVTWNGDLQNSIYINPQSSNKQYYLSRYTMKGDMWNYFITGDSFCYGSGISRGTLKFSISGGPGGDFGVLDRNLIEFKTTNDVSPFNLPKSYGDASDVQMSYSNFGKDVTISFGNVNAGDRIWLSAFRKFAFTNSRYSIKYQLSAKCNNDLPDSYNQLINLQLVPGDAGSDGSGVGEYNLFFFLLMIS
ncbi:putative agglutinin-like protein [Wickerhamomyces ciferrii]|uniref:Agglutinin-like protein n=1 Tax=Wickerhamomyces ciferrii (strain ATCC 14091 / BCRC 22168 / CBS 111 / JCM 3599 / NBRC 0793 / NRRL Y-1031 F-60-10) TaxID=1206466 RepID=K0KM09_WICCF|nr:putative agglutinin-like protein [Wickerhamomyces ciferrii]CCH42399.1 putative agglutinin-like protein [Wickerhamomyces ciferrii]